MSRTVCCIDRETGQVGTCTMEGLDQSQINRRFKKGIIDCKQCSFFKKFKGREKEEFSYTEWMGDL